MAAPSSRRRALWRLAIAALLIVAFVLAGVSACARTRGGPNWAAFTVPRPRALTVSHAPWQEKHKGGVDLSTGIYTREDDDLVLNTPMPLVLHRAYNSGDGIARQFGRDWTHAGEWWLYGDGNPSVPWADLILETGGRIHFKRVSPGTDLRGAVLRHDSTPTAFNGALLGFSGSTWEMRFRDGSIAVFLDCPRRTQVCALIERRDDDGHRIAYVRDASGTLLRMETEDGGIAFAYDNRKRIIRAFDSRGREVRYRYDDRGDIDHVTISYQGKETRARLDLAEPGTVFLPVEHTEFTAGSAEKSRRHFIELFVWQPIQTGDSWRLAWHVFEVVRSDWLPAAGAVLMTVRANEPPAVEVSQLARLQLDNGGGVESIVLAGANPTREHIESEAERVGRTAREAAQRAREAAQRARELRVDWTTVRDIRRMPSLAYADADGCRRLFVFGWSEDRAEAISVHADQELLQLATTPRTFDLAVQRMGLDVTVHVYERAIRQWPFCTDVQLPPPGLPVERWHAIGGIVTIAVTPSNARRDLKLSDASIHLSAATFVRDDGVRVVQTAPIVLTGTVGWFAG